MDFSKITVEEAIKLASIFGGLASSQVADSASKDHPYKGKMVIVRTYASGVHFAELGDYNSSERSAILKKSRRIWSWSGAFTLSAVANNGIKDGKVSEVLEEFFVNQVEEIIPCSDVAIKCLTDWKVHNG